MKNQQDINEIETNSVQPLDQQWQAIAQDWQQQEYKKTDLKALTRKTALRILKAKLIFAFDLLATLFIIIYFVVNINQIEDKATFYYLLFAVIATPIYMFYSIKIRLASWRLGQGTPTLALNAAITACQSSIHYLQLLKLSSYLFIIPINWYIFALKTSSDKSIWPALVITNLILFVIYFISHRMQKKRLAELNKLQQLLDEQQNNCN